MKSTGEVMGSTALSRSPSSRASSAAEHACPARDVFVSVRDEDKTASSRRCAPSTALGFRVIATSGTQRFLAEQGLRRTGSSRRRKAAQISWTPSRTGEVQLVFNTTEGAQALADSRSLRRAALLHKVPYYTTLSGAVAAAQGIKAYLGGDLEVRALQSYFGGRRIRGTGAGRRTVRVWDRVLGRVAG